MVPAQAGRKEPRPDGASAENNMLKTYLNRHMHEKMRADAEPMQCLGEQAPDPSFRSLARESCIFTQGNGSAWIPQ